MPTRTCLHTDTNTFCEYLEIDAGNCVSRPKFPPYIADNGWWKRLDNLGKPLGKNGQLGSISNKVKHLSKPIDWRIVKVKKLYWYSRYGSIEVLEQRFIQFGEGEGSQIIRPFQSTAQVHCRGYSMPLQRVITDFGVETVVHGVGDRAPWIAAQMQTRFGDPSNFLLDSYHVCDYLADANHVCAPNNSKAWMEQQKIRLKRNHSSWGV